MFAFIILSTTDFIFASFSLLFHEQNQFAYVNLYLTSQKFNKIMRTDCTNGLNTIKHHNLHNGWPSRPIDTPYNQTLTLMKPHWILKKATMISTTNKCQQYLNRYQWIVNAEDIMPPHEWKRISLLLFINYRRLIHSLKC